MLTWLDAKIHTSQGPELNRPGMGRAKASEVVYGVSSSLQLRP